MVPPCSDRISRVPPYSRIAQDCTRTGLSPTLARLSRRFRLILRNHWPGPRSLATTSGVSVDVLSSGYLDVSVRRVRFADLWIQSAMTHKGRVSPFGNPRINGRSPLPAAYRSVLRPSSPLSAKAFTKCPSTLDPTTIQHAGTNLPRQTPSATQHFVTHGRRTIRHAPNAGRTRQRATPTERPPAAAQPIHNVQEQNAAAGPYSPRRTRYFLRGTSHPLDTQAWWSCPKLVELPQAGGAERDRTDDLLLAKQALSQLSYSPKLVIRSTNRDLEPIEGSLAREAGARRVPRLAPTELQPR